MTTAETEATATPRTTHVPERTTCAIAGGGPAGMMLGLLLARSGVDVVALEKHVDFFRDFRGDTVHPSTLQVMYELGLLGEFLKVPHQQITDIGGQVGSTLVTIADFSQLPTTCKFMVLMPQWDFLNFLAAQAARYPSFHLAMGAEALDLLRDGDRIVGLRAATAQGEREVRADLVIAADGRSSTLRAKAGLQVRTLGAPMDVLWFRVSRHQSDPPQTLGRIDAGRIMIMLNREAYWQCGFVIPKGEFDTIRARGLDDFRNDVLSLAPFLAERVQEIATWDDVKLLTVAVDRLERWCLPGFLCIGDAAHAMSPIGGVGINLAIQDAVATANLLVEPLRARTCGAADLQAVQKRRTYPTVMTQKLQVFLQNRVIGRVLGSTGPMRPPALLRALAGVRFLRQFPARLIGMGFRPEHVRTAVNKGNELTTNR